MNLLESIQVSPATRFISLIWVLPCASCWCSQTSSHRTPAATLATPPHRLIHAVIYPANFLYRIRCG